jgi:hypothetical protein
VGILLLAVEPAAGAGRSGDPTVVAGHLDRPVPIHAGRGLATIGSLALAAGPWSITATLYLQATAAGLRTTVCRLVAGSAVDETVATTTDTGAGSIAPLLLTVVHTFGSAGDARLRCGSDGAIGDVEARFVGIEATRAGTLTNGGLSQPGTTTGSGAPIVVSGSDDGPRTIAGSLSYSDLGHLDLGAGSWWVVAKAYVVNSTTSISAFECKLTTPTDVDDQQASILSASRQPTGMQVVHTFASQGSIHLRCRAPSSLTARFIKITALKAGSLTKGPFGGSSATTGSGDPLVVSGWADGPGRVPAGTSLVSIGSLALPAGSWFITAKAWFGWNHGISPLVTTCQLVAGSDLDQDRVVLSGDASQPDANGAYLQVTHVFISGGTASVRCAQPGQAWDSYWRNVRITAVQAGILTLESL